MKYETERELQKEKQEKDALLERISQQPEWALKKG
jgi:hypothetical protein